MGLRASKLHCLV